MSKHLTLEPRPLPLTRDADGKLWVAGTSVPLERVVECHKAGDSPEEIVDAFDTLRLADVYAVISYYLDNKEEVEKYMNEREESAEAIRRMIEARQPVRPGFREELLARWKQLQEGGNASPGE
jgi:uncharacterized protein (DUF433 family)